LEREENKAALINVNTVKPLGLFAKFGRNFSTSAFYAEGASA